MASPPAPPHIVVLPFAQQGHINPLLQLSRKLAGHGFVVSFVVSENSVPNKSSLSSNINFVGVPDHLSPERSRGSSFRDSVDSMINMEAGFHDLLHRLHHLRQHPVSVVIADAFMLWSQGIASKFSIPFIFFFTASATCCALLCHLPALTSRGVLPFPRDDKDRCISEHAVRGIPGVPELLPEEFPMCLTFDASHFRYRFVTDIGNAFQKASAIIVNAFEELEPAALAAVRREKRIYAVGPLLLMSGSPSRLDVNYWPEQEHCLPWLDGRRAESVLYVSFGSVASLPTSHMRELALGLEASGQPFLWVIRPDSIDGPLEEVMPDGFLSRTEDRGLIISWGPQLMILSHAAIGGFLTHGGWNSIIENLSAGGVPMICWPHVAEQRLNRRLLVEHWKIGMEFRHEADGSVAKEEVARVVGDMMQGERGKDLRSSANKVRDMAKQAAADGGSSHHNFEALHEFLMNA